MSSAPEEGAAGAEQVVEFAIGGMTCAACSTRLEKVLNRQPGMQANVNLAAERARVRLSGHSIARAGMQLVHEDRRIFGSLNVEENIILAGLTAENRWPLERIYAMFPRLKERSWQAGGTLSGGEQQMLAVGRALMSRPKLMMMDEPSLGLAPLIVRDIFSIIKEINKRGVTILLIEQNANMALSTAHTGYVMETGRITMSGPGKELLTNVAVKAAYLGT